MVLNIPHMCTHTYMKREKNKSSNIWGFRETQNIRNYLHNSSNLCMSLKFCQASQKLESE